MKLAQEMYLWLLNKGASEIAEEVLEAAILERLAATGDENTVRRLQFISWIRRTERPLFLLIGGATGTGKSTLATELAVRLGITSVTSTDMIERPCARC